jgi:hypothetical protein
VSKRARLKGRVDVGGVCMDDEYKPPEFYLICNELISIVFSATVIFIEHGSFID